MGKLKASEERGVSILSNWDSIKDEAMYKAVLTKFQTHPELATVLLATGDAYIAEVSSFTYALGSFNAYSYPQHTPRDMYWADGGMKDTGRNQLGKTLMRVRCDLRGIEYVEVETRPPNPPAAPQKPAKRRARKAPAAPKVKAVKAVKRKAKAQLAPNKESDDESDGI